MPGHTHSKMRTAHYLACDLGAESGRLMQGTIDNRRLTLHELHRFPNVPVRESGSLRWIGVPERIGNMLAPSMGRSAGSGMF